MKLPRWIHHLYANLRGYFWAPCPQCGRHFGGHEVITAPGWTLRSTLDTGPHKILCPTCTRKGSMTWDQLKAALSAANASATNAATNATAYAAPLPNWPNPPVTSWGSLYVRDHPTAETATPTGSSAPQSAPAPKQENPAGSAGAASPGQGSDKTIPSDSPSTT